ncbi:hypothetical protein CapIbe_012041 [Capra ibex]
MKVVMLIRNQDAIVMATASSRTKDESKGTSNGSAENFHLKGFKEFREPCGKKQSPVDSKKLRSSFSQLQGTGFCQQSK